MRRFSKASVDLYPDFVRLFAELGLDDPVPSVDKWAEEWASRIVFLEENKTILGYAMFNTCCDPGHLQHLAVEPAHRRQGAGRDLMLFAANQMRLSGRTRWYLNVRVDNRPAISLYENLGFKTTSKMVVFRANTAVVERLPKIDGSIAIRRPRPDEDGLIENTFGLPLGKLADNRANANGINLGLYQLSAPDELPSGYAWYDPSFPGAYPLRLAQPTLMRQLLAHLFQLKTSKREFVQLVVEDDAVLAETLQNAGASVYLEANHMEATLQAHS